VEGGVEQEGRWCNRDSRRMTSDNTFRLDALPRCRQRTTGGLRYWHSISTLNVPRCKQHMRRAKSLLLYHSTMPSSLASIIQPATDGRSSSIIQPCPHHTCPSSSIIQPCPHLGKHPNNSTIFSSWQTSICVSVCLSVCARVSARASSPHLSGDRHMPNFHRPHGCRLDHMSLRYPYHARQMRV
jgi:hypothetical protein